MRGLGDTRALLGAFQAQLALVPALNQVAEAEHSFHVLQRPVIGAEVQEIVLVVGNVQIRVGSQTRRDLVRSRLADIEKIGGDRGVIGLESIDNLIEREWAGGA